MYAVGYGYSNTDARLTQGNSSKCVRLLAAITKNVQKYVVYEGRYNLKNLGTGHALTRVFPCAVKVFTINVCLHIVSLYKIIDKRKICISANATETAKSV